VKDVEAGHRESWRPVTCGMRKERSMKRRALAILLGSLVALGAAAARTVTRYTCTLTNKTMEKCCCVQQKDGKLYCTLAKKTVDPCCCTPAEK